jgi:hypothetical protein
MPGRCAQLGGDKLWNSTRARTIQLTPNIWLRRSYSPTTRVAMLFHSYSQSLSSYLTLSRTMPLLNVSVRVDDRIPNFIRTGQPGKNFAYQCSRSQIMLNSCRTSFTSSRCAYVQLLIHQLEGFCQPPQDPMKSTKTHACMYVAGCCYYPLTGNKTAAETPLKGEQTFSQWLPDNSSIIMEV